MNVTVMPYSMTEKEVIEWVLKEEDRIESVLEKKRGRIPDYELKAVSESMHRNLTMRAKLDPRFAKALYAATKVIFSQSDTTAKMSEDEAFKKRVLEVYGTIDENVPRQLKERPDLYFFTLAKKLTEEDGTGHMFA